MKIYVTGKETWRHGQPCDYENGIAYHKLLGPCPQCGNPTFDYGGGWRCKDPYCRCSYTNPIPNMGPAPDWWDTDINVILDGQSWCARRDNFVDLMESPVGFGRTPKEAVENLLKEEFRRTTKEGENDG